MLRNKKRALLGGAALMVALSPLAMQQAAQAATESVVIDARINAQINLTENTAMNFGILTHASAGTANLDFADTVTGGGGFQPAGGTTTSASIQIKAEAGQNIKITTVNASEILAHSTKATTLTSGKLTVTGFDFSYNGTATGAGTLTKTAVATANVLVGANLKATATQATGTYAGTFKLDVTYP